MTNQLAKVKTIKEGWDYYLSVFGEVIPEEDKFKFEGAFYAGAATYNAILFNTINKQIDQAMAGENEEVHMNITKLIMELKDEVHEFAHRRVETCEEIINEGNQRN